MRECSAEVWHRVLVAAKPLLPSGELKELAQCRAVAIDDDAQSVYVDVINSGIRSRLSQQPLHDAIEVAVARALGEPMRVVVVCGLHIVGGGD